MQKTLSKFDQHNPFFEWLDSSYLPNSNCLKSEIYLNDSCDVEHVESNLEKMFYDLFKAHKDDFIIGHVGHNPTWGGVLTDADDNYSKKMKDKYANVLKKSDIPETYTGLCRCQKGELFIPLVIALIANFIMPYSPLFYHINGKFVFYFHYTGSIALLYKLENNLIKEILEKAKENQYVVHSYKFPR